MYVRRLAVEFYFLFLLTSISPPATLAGDGYSVEFEMEDTGRGIYGRYSMVKEGGRRVGLLFGANRHSAALKTLNGEVLIAPLRNLRGGACHVVQVASERFVDCWRKWGGRGGSVQSKDRTMDISERSKTLTTCWKMKKRVEMHLMRRWGRFWRVRRSSSFPVWSGGWSGLDTEDLTISPHFKYFYLLTD